MNPFIFPIGSSRRRTDAGYLSLRLDFPFPTAPSETAEPLADP